jgi:hypothetical protein
MTDQGHTLAPWFPNANTKDVLVAVGPVLPEACPVERVAVGVGPSFLGDKTRLFSPTMPLVPVAEGCKVGFLTPLALVWIQRPC